MVGIFEGIVGGVMATGGTLLGGIGNIELGAPPPPTVAPGAVIGNPSSPQGVGLAGGCGTHTKEVSPWKICHLVGSLCS